MDTNISPALYGDSDASLRHPLLQQQQSPSAVVLDDDDDLDATGPLLSNVLHAYINTNDPESHYEGASEEQEQYVAAAVAKAATASFLGAGNSHQHQSWVSFPEEPLSLEQGVIKLVQYNPDQKTKRLGRPRKNIKHNLSAPENSSSDNFNEARYAKFRFDNKPILGPGSRGGKTDSKRTHSKGKLTFNKIRERQLQSTLSFDNKLGLVLSKDEVQAISEGMDPSLVENTYNANKDNENKNGNGNQNGNGDYQFSSTDSVTPIDDDITTTSSELAPPSTNSIGRISITYRRSMVTGASRTSFIRTRKNNKINSRVLAPVHYELYDDRLIDSQTYVDESKLPLAFGYPILLAPYAKNIMFIQSFLSKFKNVLNVGYLGPQDFEIGLGLPPIETSPTLTNRYVNLRTDVPPELKSEDEVARSSEKMLHLLYKLLSLILNRKKEVSSLLRASAELKTQFEARSRDLWQQNYSETDFPILNPFLLPLFDTQGLFAIPNPEDRLSFLTILVKWALSTSEQIRSYITNIYEGYGDNEYVSRYIQSFGSFQDSDYTATHVAKDIYDDPCSLRVLDFFAGDCGLHVGRFYLCRMADAKAGGLSSIRNMEMALHRKGIDIGDSSEFKLYVQDVHLMLTESLSSFGVEFDELGNEVPNKSSQSNNWYEIASNAKELTQFLEFLAIKLGILGASGMNSQPIRRSGKFFDGALSLYAYLSAMIPLLVAHEEMRGNNTSRRKRKEVNYNELSNARSASKLDYESDDTDFEMELPLEDNGGSDYSGDEDDDED